MFFSLLKLNIIFALRNQENDDRLNKWKTFYINPKILSSCNWWKYIPAILYSCRYNYRWTDYRRGFSCGCWKYYHNCLFHPLFYSRFYKWFFSCTCSSIRIKRQAWCEEKHCFINISFYFLYCCSNSNSIAFVLTNDVLDGDTK